MTAPSVTLRAIEPTDVDTLYIWENAPDAVRATLGTDAPVSHFQLWQYAQQPPTSPLEAGQLRMIIEADGQAAGTIDLADVSGRHGRAFAGVYVAPPFRDRGVAAEALRQLIAYARTLGLHQLSAIVEKGNEASMRLFTSAGFRTSGRLRSWIRRGRQYTDAILLQIML